MKKWFAVPVSIITGLAAVMSFAACGGGGNGGGTAEIVGDFEMVALDGDESRVTIVRDGGLNVDAGLAEIMIPKKSATIGAEYAKSPSVALPYLFTKALHNYNVTNNNISLEYLDWGWGESLMQKSEAAFKAGSGVDILIGESQMPGYAKRGELQPFPDDLAEYVRATMHPVSYKAMEIDGKIYGVAANPATCVLIWNKSVLRLANVDEKYIDQAPATWEEFLSVCEKVYNAGMSGIRYGAGGMYAGNNYGGYLRMAPFVGQAGGQFVDADGNLTFANENNVSALEFLRNVSRYNMDATLIPVNEDTLYSQFSRSKLAYLIDGSWRISMMKESGMDVGYGALPSPTGAENSNIAIGAAYLSVPAYVSSARAENAFKVIRSHLTKEVQEILMYHGIRPVSNLEIAESEQYAQVNPIQSDVYSLMDKAQIITLPSFRQDASKIWNAWGEAVEKSADRTYYGTSVTALLQEAQKKASEFTKG